MDELQVGKWTVVVMGPKAVPTGTHVTYDSQWNTSEEAWERKRELERKCSRRIDVYLHRELKEWTVEELKHEADRRIEQGGHAVESWRMRDEETGLPYYATCQKCGAHMYIRSHPRPSTGGLMWLYSCEEFEQVLDEWFPEGGGKWIRSSEPRKPLGASDAVKWSPPRI